MSFSGIILPSPLERLDWPEARAKHVRLWLKRDDGLHPFVSGNKFRKLLYNLAEAKAQGHTQLLSFGGAFSNHIHALAAAGQLWGFRTHGVIRGEAQHNPTLDFARAQGMALHFVSRSDYRQRHDAAFVARLLEHIGPAYVLPEGGSNALAVRGCTELATEIGQQLGQMPRYIIVAAGTGATAAGLALGAGPASTILAVSALKGDFLRNEIQQFVQNRLAARIRLLPDYHFGGYAKWTPDLKSFLQEMAAERALLLDPVYTGKMFFALLDQLQKGYFDEGSDVVAIHTGGLQAWAGFAQRHGWRVGEN